MPRGKKIAAALVLLAFGFGSALVFRREATIDQVEQPAARPKETLVLREPIAHGAAKQGDLSQAVKLEPATAGRRPGEIDGPTSAPSSVPDLLPELPNHFDRSIAPPASRNEAVVTEVVAKPAASTASTDRELTAKVEVPEGAPPLRTHKIVDGDTLGRLAERFLGDASRHAEIYSLNADRLPDPNVLPIGIELKLPPRDGNLALRPVQPAAKSLESLEMVVTPVPPSLSIRPDAAVSDGSAVGASATGAIAGAPVSQGAQHDGSTPLVPVPAGLPH